MSAYPQRQRSRDPVIIAGSNYIAAGAVVSNVSAAYCTASTSSFQRMPSAGSRCDRRSTASYARTFVQTPSPSQRRISVITPPHRLATQTPSPTRSLSGLSFAGQAAGLLPRSAPTQTAQASRSLRAPSATWPQPTAASLVSVAVGGSASVPVARLRQHSVLKAEIGASAITPWPCQPTIQSSSSSVSAQRRSTSQALPAEVSAKSRHVLFEHAQPDKEVTREVSQEECISDPNDFAAQVELKGPESRIANFAVEPGRRATEILVLELQEVRAAVSKLRLDNAALKAERVQDHNVSGELSQQKTDLVAELSGLKDHLTELTSAVHRVSLLAEKPASSRSEWPCRENLALKIPILSSFEQPATVLCGKAAAVLIGADILSNSALHEQSLSCAGQLSAPGFPLKSPLNERPVEDVRRLCCADIGVDLQQRTRAKLSELRQFYSQRQQPA